MRLLRIILITVWAAGVVGSCSKSTKPKPQLFIYPVASGNQWEYDLRQIRDYHDERDDDTVDTHARVTDYGPGLLTTIPEAHQFESEWQTDDGSYIAQYYYESREDGLYRVAFCGYNNEGLPRRSALARYFRMALPFVPAAPTGDCEGSPQAVDPPQPVLQYPLTIGEEWTVYTVPWTVKHRIAKWEKVTVPAGTFWCYRIDYLLPESLETEVSDYIAEIGLVKRSIVAYNLTYIDHAHQEGEVLVDQYEESVLTDVELVE